VRIVGHKVPSDLQALAHQPGAAIEIAASVPDVRPHLAAAAAVVAPVRFGTGMRGKVLEGLAMGRPVITTSLGAEGLGARSGRELLIADGAAEFAAAVAQVLSDPALATRLGRAGRAFVEQHFDWDSIAQAHDALYRELLASPLPRLRPPRDGMLRVARRLAAFGHAPALAASATLLGVRAVRHHLAGRRVRLP
jgi:glycosyltransferase involved in cell wall biosynthesis